MKMKGLVMPELGKVGYMEKEIPEIGVQDALIKVAAVAICSSDLHSIHTGMVAPGMFLGHEAVGVIEKVGSEVHDFKPGDRVMIPAVTPDWNTLECQRNLHTQCHRLGGGIRFSVEQDGSMAEYVPVIQADMNLAKIPDDMDDMTALMIVDMVTTGFTGVELANVEFGDTVAVIGIGPVGLMSVAGARAKGAGRIIAVGSRPICVELAKEYGATDIVNYKNGDIVEQILALTDGKGVDKCVIAGGNNDALGQAVAMVRAGGAVGNVNYYDTGSPLVIPSMAWGLGMGDKDIRGGLCKGGRLRMEALTNVVKYNHIDVAKLVTHKFYGIDAIEEAFHFMEKKSADMIKPVVIL